MAAGDVAVSARVLVAEDEPLMAERLVEQLAELWPEARIVARAANGHEAWQAWLEHVPDVAFLDIRMPGLTGLDVAARIAQAAVARGSTPTRIVFVTAFDQHAIEAFERGATDYLLKPIERERLAMTIRRLHEAAPATSAGLDAVLRALRGPEGEHGAWIKASSGRRIRLIAAADVRYFQSDAKYTRVVCADGSDAHVRTPIRELATRLDPAMFWQIHRGALVNVHAIAAAERIDSDRLEVVLKGSGERLPVSRAFAHRFKEE